MAESSDTNTAKANVTWSKVVARNKTKEIIFPIFIMKREILSREEAMKNPVRETEIYHSLMQEIHPNHLRGISVRGINVELKEENLFSLKARMAHKNAVHLSVLVLPESADDSVVTQFLEQRGCKIVGKVMRQMIRYNNQLTNCSTGDRMVYVEATPPSKYLENGQQYVKQKQHTDEQTHGIIPSPVYRPATEETFKFIRETFNQHVGQQLSPPKDITVLSFSEERESEMEDITPLTLEKKGEEPGKACVQDPAAAPSTKKSRKKKKRQAKKIS
ncbi:hypothetical protein ABVT39_013689 [Epinephelus coioides]